MRYLKRKRNNKGETLIETLVAILILTISAMLLAGMSATAIRINRSTEVVDATYRTEVVATEKRENGRTGKITIAEGVGGKTYDYNVDYFGIKDGLTSYKAKTEVVAP